MKKQNHILISLTPRHAYNVFAGTKTVELRRRAMHISEGTFAWIYVKLPIGAIVGCIQIGSIHIKSPENLWRDFSSVSGLSESEFFNYFEGTPEGIALEISNTTKLKAPLSLDFLRGKLSSFHPPQFFTNLNDSSPILNLLRSSRSHRPKNKKQSEKKA